MKRFLIFVLMLTVTTYTTNAQCADTEDRFMIHTVIQGDTLYKIADYHETSVQKIVEANCLSDMNFIYVGQTLRIPLEKHDVTEVNNFINIRGTGIITVQVLKVRSEPGIHGNVITYVRQGETHQIIGQLEDRSWLKIQVENHVGWVNARYVNHTKG